MIISIIILRNIFIFLILSSLVFSDCGLPAIPPNAKIKDLKTFYPENATIEYYCELSELKLLGGSIRECKNSKWVGSVPRCGEELGPGTIQRIEMTDSSGMNENNSVPIRGYDGIAFYADLNQGECITTSRNSQKPVTFKIILDRSYKHLSYFEISLHTGKEMNDTNDILDIYLNSVRSCVASVVEAAVSPRYIRRIGFQCGLETSSDDESRWSYYRKDDTQNITIKVDSARVSMCGMRIFYRKFNRFHFCGSADFPLKSSVDFIRSGSKFGQMPYYLYSCEEGFALVGNKEVRCGINNYWLDDFPSCKPIVFCPLDENYVQQNNFSLSISFEGGFWWNGTQYAVPGSKLIFSCEKNSSSSQIHMIGDSVRVCTHSGLWSGIKPICLSLDDMNVEKYKNYFVDKTDTEIDIRLDYTSDELSCGLPGLPVFAKPTPGRLGQSGDFRISYPNGTKIKYRCESNYHWMNSNFEPRTCIDGRWIGKIGKCEINYAGKVVLEKISVFDFDSGFQLSEWAAPKQDKNDSIMIGYNAFGGALRDQCYAFNLTQRQKWVFKMNDTNPISSFTIMFRPGGIYNDVNSRNRAKKSKKPIQAKIGKNFCEVSYVYDYPKFHTSITFRCDQRKISDHSVSSMSDELVFYVDPNLFNKNYDASNFSFCYLTVYHSVEDCGTPDKPLHSIVKMDGMTARFSCEDGYQLIGRESVACGRNGKWMNDFPICRLRRSLCSINKQFRVGLLENYKESQEYSLGSSLKYRCSNVSSFTGESLLIGSRTRMCLKSGLWSGDEPYCIDSETLKPKSIPAATKVVPPKENSSAITILIIVVIIAVLVAILAAFFLLITNGYIQLPIFMRKENNNLPKANQPSVRPQSVNIQDINSTLQQLSAFTVAQNKRHSNAVSLRGPNNQ